MAKYKAYAEYRDSGVEWLGEIPKHWVCTQIKYGYDITLGKMLQKNKSSSHEELKPYLKAQNIQPDGINLGVVESMWFSPEEKNKLLLKPNDVLISEGGDVGRSALWLGQLDECYIQNAINRARALNGHSPIFLNYWMYYLKTSEYISTLCNKATIAHYTAEKVESSPLLLPKFDEQLYISLFLDHKTKKIDNLIEKQQQLIELLKEKRQAVISHAITKGLNPDVPMNDSGVEWLGEMPMHWSLMRAKHIFKKILRTTTAQDGIITAFRDGQVTLRSNRRTDGFTNAIKEIGYQGVKTDDLLIHAMDGFAGAIGISDSNGKCSPVCSVCIPWHIQQVNIHYYGLLIRQLAVTGFILSLAKGIRERSTEFRFNEFSILLLPVPPLTEQILIVDNVKRDITKIDTLIEKQLQQIELLKERRTALISAAVTGKIDVRDWVAPETAATQEQESAEETFA